MFFQKISHQDTLYALILRAGYTKDGIEFFTPTDFSQQLGYMNRKKGYKISPHIHKRVDRRVTITNEVLFIKSGLVKINFFNLERVFLFSETLYQGDVILLADGGHGFEMLEDSQIIEVKQGPYAGDMDKEKF